MKKKVFDRLVEKELKKFKNYVLDDDEFMIEFLSNTFFFINDVLLF